MNGVFSMDNGLAVDSVYVFTGTGNVAMNAAGDASKQNREIVINKATGAATQVTLTPNPGRGMYVTVKDGKGDAAVNNITIIGASSALIDGQSSYVIGEPYGAVILRWNGTQWNVLAKSSPGSPQNPRNMIHGGDFTTNPWQRGTSFTGITNSATYTADRFFVIGGGSSSISVSQVADTSVEGFADSLKFQRASSNADTTALNLGQVLETLDSIRAQGQKVTLSFWAKAGANYSGGALTVALNHSTTAGNDSAAHLAAASTNWQATPTIINATQALTTTMTRYTFTGVVPATATQLGLLLTWTPTGTAGTDDSITINGIQLEVGNSASAFEHLAAGEVLSICQRFCVRFNEIASSSAIIAQGMVSTTNHEQAFLPLPVTMLARPTITVAAGTMEWNIAGTATALGTLTAGTALSTVNSAVVTDTVTATVGQATQLISGNSTGGGYVQASCDL